MDKLPDFESMPDHSDEVARRPKVLKFVFQGQYQTCRSSISDPRDQNFRATRNLTRPMLSLYQAYV